MNLPFHFRWVSARVQVLQLPKAREVEQYPQEKHALRQRLPLRIGVSEADHVRRLHLQPVSARMRAARGH